jgi:trigger factor
LVEQAIKALSNKEESTRIYDMLAENKLTQFFKSTVKLTNKEVAYDTFVEMASK